ncbi:MAG TPA: ribonuclease HII [Candidatus Omnitrophota bacterium]|nr:ribonuclease HII [Candidatus Omnitrophota bacterium]
MFKRNKPNNLTLTFEDQVKKSGFSLIIGVDEAGRGPLAGPVVACAVSIRRRNFRTIIRDSKLISPKRREEAFHEIMDNAYVGVGIISQEVIDRVNILEATFLAMTNAVNELIGKLPLRRRQAGNFHQKVCLLVDGNRFKSDLSFHHRSIIGGDNKVFSIACASIVAKVVRDRILSCYDRIYPQYGFSQHKGYPTPAHKAALRRFGPSLIHRKSFSY